MYKPVRPRPKKTNITRSRGGCLGCRQRRTKCDQAKPACGTCTRLGRVCEAYKPAFQFHNVTPTPRDSPVLQTETPPHSEDGVSEQSYSMSNDEYTAPVSSFRFNDEISTTVDPGILLEIPEAVTNKDTSASGYYVGTIAKYKASGPSLPPLSIIKSLQQTERDIFYTGYWEQQCLPALHPVFQQVTHLLSDSQTLQNTILGLSACNFSRIYAERIPVTSASQTVTTRPDPTHQIRSQLYYNAAIRKVARLTRDEYICNPTLTFTILVLFCYMECSMGNFHGFNSHMFGITAFLEHESQGISQTPIGQQILAAWMQSRYRLWWQRTYFSTLDHQLHQEPTPLPPSLQQRLGTLHERRVSVLSILCESHRLNFQHVLRNWAPKHLPKEQTTHLLAIESAKLDTWHNHLPASELPIDPTPDPTLPLTDPDLPITPLYFTTHHAALNYTYYALSRALQCPTLLSTITEPQSSPTTPPTTPWIPLILRIVSGTNPQIAIHQNTYTLGFSNLLLATLLRTQDPAIGSWIETWLTDLLAVHPMEEGSFPVFQTLDVVKTVNRERRNGVDVFGLSQVDDDGGGRAKFDGFNSQFIKGVLVHGRERETGELVTRFVVVG